MGPLSGCWRPGRFQRFEVLRTQSWEGCDEAPPTRVQCSCPGERARGHRERREGGQQLLAVGEPGGWSLTGEALCPRCPHPEGDLVEVEANAYRITKGNLGIPGFPVNLILYPLPRNKIRQKYSKTTFKKNLACTFFFYFDHKAF